MKPDLLPSPEVKPVPRGVAGARVSEAPRMAGRGRIKVSKTSGYFPDVLSFPVGVKIQLTSSVTRVPVTDLIKHS